MQDSNFYLKSGWYIFILPLVIITTIIVFSFLGLNDGFSPDSIKYDKIAYQVFTIAFWLIIGKICGSFKNAIIAIAINLGLSVIENYFFYSQDSYASLFQLSGYFFFRSISNALPYVVFLILETRKFRFEMLLFLVLGLGNYSALISSVTNAIFSIADSGMLSYGINKFIFMIPRFVILMLVMFELLKYLKNNKDLKQLNDKLLNFNNEYSKPLSSLIFISLKIGIFITIQSIVDFSNPDFGSNLGVTDINFIVRLYHLLGNFLALGFYFWYFRKFLTEYFLSYDIPISWKYYLCLLPFLGLFVWFRVLIKYGFVNSPSQKRDLFEDREDNFKILFFIIFISILQLLWSIFSNSSNFQVNQSDDFGNSSSMLMIFGIITFLNIVLLKFSYDNPKVWNYGFVFQVAMIAAYLIFSFFVDLHKDFNHLNILKLVFSAFLFYNLFSLFHLQEFWYVDDSEKA